MKHVQKTTRARRWFLLGAHDEGGEGGSGEGGEGEGAGGGGEGGNDGGGGDESFTQADVDRIVQERLARERQKYSDYDDVKAKAERYDELEAEQQSDLEKAEREAEQLRQENEQLKQQQTSSRRRRALERAAAEAKFHDPADAAAQIDEDLLEVDEDGNVTNAEALVSDLAERKQYLVRSDDGGSGGSGPGDGDGGVKPPPDKDKDFTKASDDDFKSELGKYGLRART